MGCCHQLNRLPASQLVLRLASQALEIHGRTDALYATLLLMSGLHLSSTYAHSCTCKLLAPLTQSQLFAASAVSTCSASL